MITSDGITILNAAREILKRADTEAMNAAWDASREISADVANAQDLGRVAEAADTAEGAIFNFLNVANNFGKVEMTYEQLHGRPVSKEVENV